MQTAMNPVNPALAQVIGAMDSIKPVTPEGTPTVAAQVMQAAQQAAMPQIAHQAGLAGQIQAMQQQQAQQAMMQQAMAQRPPAGIEGLNPQMGNFAEGGIIGYAGAGTADDEDESFVEPAESGGEMIEQPAEGGDMVAPAAEAGAEGQRPVLPEAGLAGLARSSAPAIAEMRRIAGEQAKMPINADPRKAIESAIARRQAINDYARATGNDPDMVAKQISQMEDLYRRRDQALEQRYQETAGRKDKESLAEYLMNFRQMKGRPVSEGLVSASRGLARFQGGLDARMQEIGDLRLQLEGLKIEKINSLKALKYNTDMGYMNDAMKEQQRLIDNDRNTKAIEYKIAEKVAGIHSQEARTAAQLEERANRPNKAANVYVKSTYTDNKGQRVAIMSDGTEKTLGSTLEVNNRIANLISNQEKANAQFRRLPEEEKKKWAMDRLALSEKESAPAAPAQQPMYARNPKTGERIMSTDGGQTWNPAR